MHYLLKVKGVRMYFVRWDGDHEVWCRKKSKAFCFKTLLQAAGVIEFIPQGIACEIVTIEKEQQK